MSKQELIEKIHVVRMALDNALGKVGDQQTSLVILHGEWSVKDMLSHIGFWEERVVYLFETLKAGKVPEKISNLDAANQNALELWRGKPWKQVLAFEKNAYQKVLEIIQDADDGELFNPQHFSWTNGESFEEIISNNTWGHYEEHLLELDAWLGRVA